MLYVATLNGFYEFALKSPRDVTEDFLMEVLKRVVSVCNNNFGRDITSMFDVIFVVTTLHVRFQK
jgi:hypothetical protein